MEGIILKATLCVTEDIVARRALAEALPSSATPPGALPQTISVGHPGHPLPERRPKPEIRLLANPARPHSSR